MHTTMRRHPARADLSNLRPRLRGLEWLVIAFLVVVELAAVQVGPAEVADTAEP